jgi:hypothetical protein
MDGLDARKELRMQPHPVVMRRESWCDVLLQLL